MKFGFNLCKLYGCLNWAHLYHGIFISFKSLGHQNLSPPHASSGHSHRHYSHCIGSFLFILGDHVKIEIGTSREWSLLPFVWILCFQTLKCLLSANLRDDIFRPHIISWSIYLGHISVQKKEVHYVNPVWEFEHLMSNCRET